VGADVVEVAPVYDSVAETTTLAAAEVARSLLELMVATPIVDAIPVVEDKKEDGHIYT
jgi:agmatinase